MRYSLVMLLVGCVGESFWYEPDAEAPGPLPPEPIEGVAFGGDRDGAAPVDALDAGHALPPRAGSAAPRLDAGHVAGAASTTQGGAGGTTVAGSSAPDASTDAAEPVLDAGSPFPTRAPDLVYTADALPDGAWIVTGGGLSSAAGGVLTMVDPGPGLEWYSRPWSASAGAYVEFDARPTGGTGSHAFFVGAALEPTAWLHLGLQPGAIHFRSGDCPNARDSVAADIGDGMHTFGLLFGDHTADVFLDGTLVADDVPLCTNSGGPAGMSGVQFGLCCGSPSGGGEVDEIRAWSGS